MPSPDGTRAVLLDDESIRTATILWDLLKSDWKLLGKTMGILDGYFPRLARGTRCVTCDAECGEPCVTASGKRAGRPHRSRAIAILAVMFAMAKEITITEEDDIDDILEGK